MALDQYKIAVFGKGKANLATVGYSLQNSDGTANGTRQGGVMSLGAGSYGAMVTIPDGFSGVIVWDTGGTSPVFAFEEINLNTRIDMNQPVPVRDLTDVTVQNTGDCLSSTRSDAAGAMELNVDAKTQTMHGPNGEVVRVFTVDDVDRPTQRA